jgi:hypothetical protein
MSNQPDFTHGGEFIEWPDDANLDEHFPPLIDLARLNIGEDVELVRWSPDDALADQYARWWAKQGRAIRRHVGPLTGMKVTARSRMHTDLGVKIAYVRFNRTRPAVIRVEEAS